MASRVFVLLLIHPQDHLLSMSSCRVLYCRVFAGHAFSFKKAPLIPPSVCWGLLSVVVGDVCVCRCAVVYGRQWHRAKGRGV